MGPEGPEMQRAKVVQNGTSRARYHQPSSLARVAGTASKEEWPLKPQSGSFAAKGPKASSTSCCRRSPLDLQGSLAAVASCKRLNCG